MSAENVIWYVENVLIPKLTPERARDIFDAAKREGDVSSPSHNAQRAAISAGIESEAVRFSERLRAAAWSIVWSDSQVEAWEMSWILSRAGMGIATLDLVGTESYSVNDYIALVQPWVSGFPDFPIPVKEEA